MKRLELTLSDEVWAVLEAARGDVPRATFVKRALESALDGGGGSRDPYTEFSRQRERDPASTRAPVEKGSARAGSTSPGGDASRRGRGSAPSRPAATGDPLPKIAPRRVSQ